MSDRQGGDRQAAARRYLADRDAVLAGMDDSQLRRQYMRRGVAMIASGSALEVLGLAGCISISMSGHLTSLAALFAVGLALSVIGIGAGVALTTIGVKLLLAARVASYDWVSYQAQYQKARPSDAGDSASERPPLEPGG